MTSRYTDADVRRANEMFAEAVRNGTLKPPRAIAVMGDHAISESQVTFRNYLADAKRERLAKLKRLAKRKR